MEGQISPEQFQINHLKKRVGQITEDYEGSVAQLATELAIARQELRKSREESQQLAQQLLALQAHLEEQLTGDASSSESPEPEVDSEES